MSIEMHYVISMKSYCSYIIAVYIQSQIRNVILSDWSIVIIGLIEVFGNIIEGRYAPMLLFLSDFLHDDT